MSLSNAETFRPNQSEALTVSSPTDVQALQLYEHSSGRSI